MVTEGVSVAFITNRREFPQLCEALSRVIADFFFLSNLEFLGEYIGILVWWMLYEFNPERAQYIILLVTRVKVYSLCLGCFSST